MKRPVIVGLAAALLLAGKNPGFPPRGNPSDYPAHQTAKGITVAAAAIAPEQVAKLFGNAVNRAGYVVIEVAVYPEGGRELEVLARDFRLQFGSNPTSMHPASARIITADVQPKNVPPPKLPSNVTVYTSTTVGYETGGQRHGGVYTGTAVGVGIGNPGQAPPPPAPSADLDPATLELELDDHGLPEGKTTEPVAGYLYFLRPSGAKAGYRLTYFAPEGEIRLTIPPAKKK